MEMTMNLKKKSTFEESLTVLEKIVAELESSALPLDEGLEKFEQGIALYRECKDQLSKAEKKIKLLTDKLKEENLE
jgi:exodeoxyribonuclease VII small subunit